MRFPFRVIMLVAALALGLAAPAQAAPAKKTVKVVATSLSGKRIYLDHHVSYCVKKNDCEPSAKDGTSKVAKYTQTVKVRRKHGVWINTAAIKPHRVRVYVNGKLVYDKKAKWHAQDDAGFYIADYTYFNR
ncbi:hypothetical protein ABGB12_31805 [Actinocorallia sp. B10E7]|uniref:hypothetical protein n=1 Tax=Actinocorallia sp. B10E7 TaxID=3153558 RepID=UPI00325D4547